jgi:trimethylamine:corrinoid methyltransferase-like protein
MSLPDTVTRFRDFYYFPTLFRHWNLERWRAEGEPAILGEAWARAKEEIAASTFQLADDQRREVDRIYQKAQSRILRQ